MSRLANFFEVLAFLSISAVIVGCFGRWHFLPDLASHFRIQAAGVLLVSGLLLWPLKRRSWSIASLACGVGLAISLLPFVPSAAQTQQAKYRLLTMNVLTRNTRKDLVVDYILRQQPDFVLLQETDNVWIGALDAALAETWPYSKRVPQSDNFGIAMYSKMPWSACDIVVYSEEISSPSISATLQLPDGSPLRLIVTHPVPPMNGICWRSRNELFTNIASDVQSSGSERTMVAGDLNCTPWSAHFVDFLEKSQLANSAVGHGLGVSWRPLPWLPMGLPIDHVLVGDRIRVAKRVVGPYLGSDHRPVVVDFD